MLKRLLLAGVISASALSLAPAASANPSCAEGFETICTAIWVVQTATCHPKYNPC